jgi:hypothetical protein
VNREFGHELSFSSLSNVRRHSLRWGTIRQTRELSLDSWGEWYRWHNCISIV